MFIDEKSPKKQALEILTLCSFSIVLTLHDLHEKEKRIIQLKQVNPPSPLISSTMKSKILCLWRQRKGSQDPSRADILPLNLISKCFTALPGSQFDLYASHSKMFATSQILHALGLRYAFPQSCPLECFTRLCSTNSELVLQNFSHQSKLSVCVFLSPLQNP